MTEMSPVHHLRNDLKERCNRLYSFSDIEEIYKSLIDFLNYAQDMRQTEATIKHRNIQIACEPDVLRHLSLAEFFNQQRSKNLDLLNSLETLEELLKFSTNFKFPKTFKKWCEVRPDLEKVHFNALTYIVDIYEIRKIQLPSDLEYVKTTRERDEAERKKEREEELAGMRVVKKQIELEQQLHNLRINRI